MCRQSELLNGRDVDGQVVLVCSKADGRKRPEWTALTDFATLNWPHFDRYIWPHPNR
jgi:hypothetical protein